MRFQSKRLGPEAIFQNKKYDLSDFNILYLKFSEKYLIINSQVSLLYCEPGLLL
jgi:hypothetical protein